MNASTPGEPREPGSREQLVSPYGAEYHASLEKRVSILEMRFDTILPTLATKADIAEIRVEIAKLSERLHEDMYKLHRQLLMWIVSTMIAMFLGMVGLFIGLTSAMIDASLTQLNPTNSVPQATPGPPAPR